MNPKFKKIIFDKLYEDLGKSEIIQHKDSIWFINRDKKYWYFEYEKSGELWWRFTFFIKFFKLFSIERIDFEPIISEWVEEVLNCKVLRSTSLALMTPPLVEEVLNCKVLKTETWFSIQLKDVEEALNCKVLTTTVGRLPAMVTVEEVLNYKVLTMEPNEVIGRKKVEEVLDYKVLKTRLQQECSQIRAEEILNCSESTIN